MTTEIGSPTTTAGTATIAEQIADYVTGLHYEDIPSAVVAKAKELLAFHVGVALQGRSMRSGQRAVRLALELGGTGRSCSIIGEPHRTGLLEAVMANYALMSSGGRYDVLFPSGVLAGVTVHPAAWAVGEEVHASGRELLAAIVVGYDVMAKLHHGVLPYDLAVPRPTKAAVEPFGVAAAAARLLGLSTEQTVHAMAHAGQSVMGVYEGGGGSLVMMHPLTARNGVMAAMLASAGISGTSTIVEGPHGVYRTFFVEDVPDTVRANLSTLGRDLEVAKARVTLHPVSLANALPIELTKQLIAEYNLSADQVTTVNLVLPKNRESREAIYGTYAKGPSTVVAIALTDGRFETARFEEELDAEVLAVRDKVDLTFEEGRDFFYARVEITTTSGKCHTAEADGPVDMPSIDWARWLTDNGRTHLTDAKLADLVDLLSHLEDVDDVGDVMRCVVP